MEYSCIKFFKEIMNYPDPRVEVSMVNNLPLPLRVFSYPAERDGKPLSASPFPPYQGRCLKDRVVIKEYGFTPTQASGNSLD